MSIPHRGPTPFDLVDLRRNGATLRCEVRHTPRGMDLVLVGYIDGEGLVTEVEIRRVWTSAGETMEAPLSGPYRQLERDLYDWWLALNLTDRGYGWTESLCFHTFLARWERRAA